MESESKTIKLFTEGKVITGDGQDFTRLIGGFGDDKPSITDKQIAELLNYRHGARQVREQVFNNIKHFNFGLDIIDLKRVDNNFGLVDTLIELGYAKQSITQASNIYLFSHTGFSKFVQIADLDIDLSSFEKEYFLEEKIINYSIFRYEKILKETLTKTFRNIIKIIPQYICCNNKYRIDFYCKKLNLAIEYDEKFHKYQQNEDKIREQEIHNELGCDFIRIEKGFELEGINKIFRYILTKKAS